MQKPPRPTPPEVEEEDYDDGDPYSCIAAGFAGVQQKSPNYPYLLIEAFKSGRPEQVEELAARDLASVKTALYDLWDSGRYFKSAHALGCWAARQMDRLGDSSLLDYDRAVPPEPS